MAQRDQALRQSMFNLVKGRFAERLLANARGSYPRGSFDCLRAFAFWVSFVRHEFCRDRQLVLSPEALRALQQWVRHHALLPPHTSLPPSHPRALPFPLRLHIRPSCGVAHPRAERFGSSDLDHQSRFEEDSTKVRVA